MRIVSCFLVGSFVALQAASVCAADGLGFTASTDALPWSRWQGRISLGAAPPVWRSGLGGFERSGLQLGAMSLMGDYYFALPVSGTSLRGFRATSGVIVGPRSLWLSGPASALADSGLTVERRLGNAIPQSASTEPVDEPVAVLPYVGIGYTGLARPDGWRFSADLGVLAAPGKDLVSFGSAAAYGAALTDPLRDRRVAPVVQLGVSHSF